MEDQSLLQVRLPAELLAEVDAVAGDRGRAVFVRLALRAFLDHMKAPMVTPADEARVAMEPSALLAELPMVKVDGDTYRHEPKVAAPVVRLVPPKPVAKPDGLSARGKVVLSVVTERRSVTLNEVVRHLGWAPRGVDQAAEELRRAGLVRLSGVTMELVE